ncbi:MAG: D-alanyl-D-alanine carboxypeptidase, partial [Deltaproteobacteria bacterium]|nr:D-alanyl-D-alanine carboxypeptidase [Deltaproteobacteria bacterium]
YTPASIFKIITALASLEILGEGYRFPTSFHLTPALDLWIKGGGDPLLTSEVIGEMSKELRKRGLRVFRHLYIDDSLYALEEKSISETTTSNPYDAPLSALGVNFNTVNIKIAADSSIHSNEVQTPTIPLMQELGAGLAPGTHRLNVSLKSGQTQRLAAETFQAIFAQNGITMQGRMAIGRVPVEAGLLYTHASRPLLELLPAMLLYSNNFTANQLFLALGHEQFGAPVTWSKGRRALTLFAEKKGVTPDHIAIMDGAGLNRGNRISAAAMLVFLEDFRPYHYLLPHHKEGLFKSGTMNGVYSYAGYLGQGQNDPAVVIILNQTDNNRNIILKRLAEEMRPH